MLGYYELEEDMIIRLPKESRDIKENIYEICCPLVVKTKESLPQDLRCLYEVLEIPIISFDEIGNCIEEKYQNRYLYLKEFSKYLKMNITIEELEEGRLGHLLRVGKNAKALCDALGLTKEQTKNIYIAALFHDVGKYKVPSSIVGKKGRLSDSEFNVIKNHCNYGYDILKGFLAEDTLNIIRSHHERCDGSGYPKGSIPELGAKIIGIVDSFDAMTSNRVYCKGKNLEDAYEELLLCGQSVTDGGKGILFDKELVEKFIHIND